jgi:hypothetical protein
MRQPTSLLCGLFLVAIATGCAIRNDLESAPINPTLKSEVDDTGSDPTRGTKYCSPRSDGQFDDSTISLQSGQTPSDGSAWAEGGGCIVRPIREVWATLNNLEVTKIDAADRFTYTRAINPKPGFTHLYEITYYKSTIIGEIQWTIDWYHGVSKGTVDAPEEVVIQYDRVRGTSNIPVWHGGITLTKVNNSVTSIAIRNDFKARQSTTDNEQSARDFLDEMVGDSRNGSPDWERLNDGFKDNPSAPDAAASGDGTRALGVFCLKNSEGKYPDHGDIASGTDQGVSWVKLRACLLADASDVFDASKDPDAIRWVNASKESGPGKLDASSSQLVSYEKSHFLGFIFGTSQWDMSWQYNSVAATPSQYAVLYKVDPATVDFPVWNGKISIGTVESGVASVEIDNELLTNEVSASLEENKKLTLGLLASLKSASKAR